MSLAVWHSGSKAETLMFLREGKVLLTPEFSDSMSQVEKEDKIDEWLVAVLECRICGKRQLAVLPSVAPLENMECQECLNMSCDPVEEDEY